MHPRLGCRGCRARLIICFGGGVRPPVVERLVRGVINRRVIRAILPAPAAQGPQLAPSTMEAK